MSLIFFLGRSDGPRMREASPKGGVSFFFAGPIPLEFTALSGYNSTSIFN